MVHLFDYLHAQQLSLLSLIRYVHQSRGQYGDNNSGKAFSQQSFPEATNIWNKQVMHEFSHQEGGQPHSERYDFGARTKAPRHGMTSTCDLCGSHEIIHRELLILLAQS
jgi:hypothetical protein